MKRFLLSAMLVAATLSTQAQGQLKLPALSPTCKMSQEFSVSNIEITYSRPSMRGRKIFGDVVPFGKVWRTGANAPTKIKFGEDVEIAGHKVKAGEYGFYTIPGKDKWEIVLNTAAAPWTADGFPKENDVARFTVKPSAIDGNCQTFTILITDLTYTSCKIEMVWEKTRIVLPVVAHNEDAIAENVDKAINHPAPPPYFSVANYYYETDQKPEVALSYVNKALEDNPKAFYMWYLKARIEKRLGNKEEAIAAAKKSMETAKGSPNENEYTHNNQKLLDEIEKTTKRRQSAD